MGYFGKVPSYYTFSNRDIESLHRDFPGQFEKSILGKHFRKGFNRKDYKAEIIDVLKDKNLVEQEPDEVTAYFYDEISAFLHQLLEFLKGFKIDIPDKPHIGAEEMISSDRYIIYLLKTPSVK